MYGKVNTTIYGNNLTLQEEGRKIILESDLWKKMISDYGFKVTNQRDTIVLIRFSGDENFNLHALGNRGTKDIYLLKHYQCKRLKGVFCSKVSYISSKNSISAM